MELTIKTSIIDYQDVVNGGVNILIGITLEDDFTFEGYYWIHPNGNDAIEVDEKFLKLFGIENVEDLPFFEELKKDINSILPDREEIFKELIK